ncbi:MAG: response regulator [Candidatus Omnitrophica bacterium]|nr:response regulator [Candidatus Omnitrophota bacterium]
MPAKCPLFQNEKVICRVKPDSQHRWIGTERTWYIRNYCQADYYVDCEDFEAYLEQQAIVKGKILVVDDETTMLETLSSFFSSRGYQMMTAASAEAALKLLAAEQPALIFIDIKLPGMNGLELLKEIKQRYPAVKTFVITAFDEENKKAAEALGCDAFFAKPVGLDALKKRVIEVLTDSERRLMKTLASRQKVDGVPAARLLFVIEVLPTEKDRLTPYFRECFTDEARCGGHYELDFAYSINDTLQKLMSFKPDIVLINFDTLYQIPCGQLASRIVESPYRPKEVIVYGLNLEASDKQAIEQLGLQYVDQRRSFAKLVTTIKHTALRLNGHSSKT